MKLSNSFFYTLRENQKDEKELQEVISWHRFM